MLKPMASNESDDPEKPFFKDSPHALEEHNSASSQRRADIDGLRAVAVLSVIAFHFNPTWLPGGFTGVDIFFTISGYVNTASLIHGDLPLCDKTFAFFGRRMWRLAPPLMATVLTTVVFTNIFTPTYVLDLNGYYTAGLLGLFGLSNNYFASLQLDYFERGHKNLALNPFTHLWSLGVEEQFYILFPFVLGCAQKLSANRSPLIVLIVFSVISATVSCILSNVNTQVAFYTLPSRFWELSLGSCAFYIPASMDALYGCTIATGSINYLLQVAAVLLLIVSLVFTPSDSGFPFPYASLAVGGTFCFILAGSSPSSVPNACCSHRLMVYIGSLSYSLYLWHWPVLVWFRLTECLAYSGAHLIAMVHVLSLSIATYHGIEVPMNRNRPTKPCNMFGYVAPVLAIVAATSWALGFHFDGALYVHATCTRAHLTVDTFQNSSANTSNKVLEVCPGAGDWHESSFTWRPEHPSSCRTGFAWPKEDGEQRNRSVIFIGDSTMSRTFRQGSKACSTQWHVIRKGYWCGLPEYLGMERAPMWVSPAPNSLMGPTARGLDNPFCMDCVGCASTRGQCTIADVPFDLEYIGVEFTKDVEMPTTRSNTTIGSVIAYIHSQRKYVDAIFINSCIHDMYFKPDVFTTELYVQRVRSNLLSLQGSAKVIVWVSCNHFREDAGHSTNARGLRWNEAVRSMINAELPNVAYFDVAKMSQVQAMHHDRCHMVPEWYDNVVDIMLNFVVRGPGHTTS
ncbi:unnamed protein product [Prorocentrum cordatum]|uniref:Acyltransferase 3 domain-containing protein n=1 Tax=Prorocentrum cordatum TaxID=2364126 RepID=A0ABN9QT69_9DINO|nr:unnamed protein product [Polarella glacialis]